MDLLYAFAVQMTLCTIEIYHFIPCIQYIKVEQMRALMLEKEEDGMQRQHAALSAAVQQQSRTDHFPAQF